MFVMLGNALLDVVGGMAVAVLAATAAWRVFQWIGLPELGPWVVLGVIVAIPGAVHRSFIQMLILFLAIAAIALLSEGKAWRERRRLHKLVQDLANPREEQGNDLNLHLHT